VSWRSFFLSPSSPRFPRPSLRNMSFASNPSHGSISPGKCVVCGKETWMRCSACSQAGLDWMSFCSVEHQKLVSTARSLVIERGRAGDTWMQIWFMHKRVCGANPFKWPEFTKKEINEMIAYSRKLAKVGPETTTWLTYVVPFAKSDGSVREIPERETAFRVRFSTLDLLLTNADSTPLYLSRISSK